MYINKVATMHKANITELRKYLPKYLLAATKGDEILVTSHGKIIARILPPTDVCLEAKARLRTLRKTCNVKDVVTPVSDKWNAAK